MTAINHNSDADGTAATGVVPDLEPWCGSWIIVSRTTGIAVFETYVRATAAAVNQDRYEVLTAATYLERFNRTARASQQPVSDVVYDTTTTPHHATPRHHPTSLRY